ncbi:hypothetical protein MPLB_280043 [Mesorhizobium sp. ORS 3324]|nr:hypothetical protein MPLB_280043 [Mesorhizobium sp. ORS 3324]
MREKVDRRAAPRRLRGVGRIAVFAKLEHPSSVAFGDTFSHKGRRENRHPATNANASLAFARLGHLAKLTVRPDEGSRPACHQIEWLP